MRIEKVQITSLINGKSIYVYYQTPFSFQITLYFTGFQELVARCIKPQIRMRLVWMIIIFTWYHLRKDAACTPNVDRAVVMLRMQLKLGSLIRCTWGCHGKVSLATRRKLVRNKNDKTRGHTHVMVVVFIQDPTHSEISYFEHERVRIDEDVGRG